MLQGIDHIVIAVPDLEATTQRYRDLGFTVVEGGKHPTGSYNSLIGFADGSYVELLSFYEDSPDHYWWHDLYQRGGGLIDFCMQTDDIQADYQAFREAGVEMGDLVSLGRKRPDGYQLEWINNKTLGQFRGIIPFIIEDKTPRSERVPQADHANGVIGIDTITLIAPDLDLVQDIYQAVLGTSGEVIPRDDLYAHGLQYAIGSHNLLYITPAGAESPLHERIQDNKPQPYSITLKTKGEAHLLLPEQTDGVLMELRQN